MLTFPPPNKAMHWDGLREELADAGLDTEIWAYEDRVELPGLDESHRDQVLAIAQAHAGQPPRAERQLDAVIARMRQIVTSGQNAVDNWANLTTAQRSTVQRETTQATVDIVRYLMRDLLA